MKAWQMMNAELQGAFAAALPLTTRQAGAMFAREARRMGFVRGSHDFSAFYAQAMHAYKAVRKDATSERSRGHAAYHA